MVKNLDEALKNVDGTYKELIEYANNIVSRCTAECDKLISYASENIENMSNEKTREIMLKLIITSYSFSEIKEKSAFKAEIAEAIRKENFATNFTTAAGTSATAKENIAVINTSEDIVVEALYNYVASALKTKQDVVFRTIDVLKTVLMSRMSEAKLNNITDAME